jgi:hypothetical protein
MYRTMYSRYRNVVLGGHANELRGTVEGERGGGEGERRVQFTANQGHEWTGIRATAQEGDFQVSIKGLTGAGR